MIGKEGKKVSNDWKNGEKSFQSLENRFLTGLYVHVPFCVRKCGYCDFYSEEGAGEGFVKLYLDGLARELERLPAEFEPDTVFIGGGTPTALDAVSLGRLLGMVSERAVSSNVVEFTCEVNPGTLTREKAEVLATHGVTRVSIGAQSFEDEALRFLGRIHGAGEIDAALEAARGAGIREIGLDIIHGLPRMARSGGIEGDLRAAAARGPDHISCYGLSYEPGTPLERAAREGAIEPLDDDACRDEYDFMREWLGRAGYAQYEISNFARPGRECRHNLIYWTGGDYLGVGPAAHSFWKGNRHFNPPDVSAWRKGVDAGRWIQCAEEPLEPAARAREMLVMGLRLMRGVEEDAFKERFGFSPEELRGEEIRQLIELNILIKEGKRLKLSNMALFVSNAVFERLI